MLPLKRLIKCEQWKNVASRKKSVWWEGKLGAAARPYMHHIYDPVRRGQWSCEGRRLDRTKVGEQPALVEP